MVTRDKKDRRKHPPIQNEIWSLTTKVAALFALTAGVIGSVTFLQNFFILRPMQNFMSEERVARQAADTTLFSAVTNLDKKMNYVIDMNQDVLTNQTYSKREINGMMRKVTNQVDSLVAKQIHNRRDSEELVEKSKKHK